MKKIKITLAIALALILSLFTLVACSNDSGKAEEQDSKQYLPIFEKHLSGKIFGSDNTYTFGDNLDMTYHYVNLEGTEFIYEYEIISMEEDKDVVEFEYVLKKSRGDGDDIIDKDDIETAQYYIEENTLKCHGFSYSFITPEELEQVRIELEERKKETEKVTHPLEQYRKVYDEYLSGKKFGSTDYCYDAFVFGEDFTVTEINTYSDKDLSITCEISSITNSKDKLIVEYKSRFSIVELEVYKDKQYILCDYREQHQLEE